MVHLLVSSRKQSPVRFTYHPDYIFMCICFVNEMETFEKLMNETISVGLR